MGSIAQLVDETGVRIADVIYRMTEEAITETMQEGCYDLAERAGADRRIAEMIESRMRYAITTVLAERFKSAAAGWEEMHQINSSGFLESLKEGKGE